MTINWTQISDNASGDVTLRPTLIDHIVKHGNNLIAFGRQQHDPNPDTLIIWSSPDGIVWTQISTATGVTTIHDYAAVSFKGKLWILCGAQGINGSGLATDNWFSDDGITWSNVSIPFVKRYGCTAVVFLNKLWLIGGDDGSDNVPDVTYSDDGINWSDVFVSGSLGRMNSAVCVHDRKLWVTGGVNIAGEGDSTIQLLNSTDGIAWNLIATNANFSGNTVNLYSAADGLWLINPISDSGLMSMLSTDGGVTWTTFTQAQTANTPTNAGAVINGTVKSASEFNANLGSDIYWEIFESDINNFIDAEDGVVGPSTFLTVQNKSQMVLQKSVDTSTGISDQGKMVALNVNGKLDLSMFPPEILALLSP